jgi:hypothetical protein
MAKAYAQGASMSLGVVAFPTFVFIVVMVVASQGIMIFVEIPAAKASADNALQNARRPETLKDFIMNPKGVSDPDCTEGYQITALFWSLAMSGNELDYDYKAFKGVIQEAFDAAKASKFTIVATEELSLSPRVISCFNWAVC